MNCMSASSFAKDGGAPGLGFVDFFPLDLWDLMGEVGGTSLNLDFFDRRIENGRKRLVDPGFLADTDVGVLT